MSPAGTVVIGTGPHGFAGAGTIHGHLSALLARAGYEVSLLAWEPPYRGDEMASAGVVIDVPEIVSDAFPRSDALRTLAVVREILARARAAAGRGSNVVLIGTYLFPFYQAVEKAAAMLTAEGVRVTSVAIPAGSDVWQVAVQVPELARDLLRSRHTHVRVSYSRRFADEIAAWLGECGAFEIIPPPVDVTAFHPASPDEKRLIRRRLGISHDAVVLLNCGNMRPIKGPEQTLRIAREFAAASAREVVLLLVGPMVPHLKRCLGLPADAEVKPGELLRSGRLTIRLEGLQRHTRDYHVAADVALNTSYHDSFNLSLAESLACGTPVVSSDVVGIREIANGARLGHFFAYAGCEARSMRPGSPRELPAERMDDIVRALVEMAHHPDALRRMGVEGRRAVVRALAPDHVLEQWEGLIQARVRHGQWQPGGPARR